MGVPVTHLQALISPYQYCPLECDGLSKVLSTLLWKQGIDHTVYVGTLVHRGKGTIHVWIELETSEGHRTIDYCARQWLGQNKEVPHGVFDQGNYRDVEYIGEPSSLEPLDTSLFAVFTTPVTQLLESLSFALPILYTVGYRQPYAEAVLRFLASRGFPIIDIRERAGSRFNKMYNRARLEDRFPGMYHRVPELGNVNHNELGAQIEFKDLEAGMKESQRIIMEDAAGTGAVYLCACETWPTCHRSQAAIHLQEHIAGLTVIHLEADGTFQLARTSHVENVETIVSTNR